MNNIVFNGGSLRSGLYYGVQRYTFEILKALDSMVEPGVIQLLVPAQGERNVSFQNIEVVKSKHNRRKKIEVLFWDQIFFPYYAKKNKRISVDLLVALPLVGCDISAIHDCRTVIMAQNAKSIAEKLKRLFYIWRVRTSTKKSKRIITVSENAKNDICRLFGCRPEKIHVIYNAWQHFQQIDIDESIIDELGLHNKDYFFSLGSKMRHKNIRWIVSAAMQNPYYTFVITGNSSVNESDIEYINRKADNVIYTGYLCDAKVKALMMHCKAFIQPSLYEGFGIPPMEAMSTGARCIVSNSSSLPEVYGKSVWYIDPKKYDNINLDYIMSGDIEENGVVLEKFSWKRSAAQLKEIISMNIY